MMFDIGVD